MSAAIRPGMAVTRTVDLLQAVDAYARDGGWATKEYGLNYSLERDLLAIRHLCECLTRIVQAHPGVAEFAEGFAAQAAEALDLVEVDA